MKRETTGTAEILLVNSVTTTVLQDFEIQDLFYLVLKNPETGHSKVIEINPTIYSQIYEYLTLNKAST